MSTLNAFAMPKKKNGNDDKSHPALNIIGGSK